jgi:DNA-binding winged helix-turn-helix (wHTH) protein
VARLLVIGFGHPESLRLLEELRRRAPQHDFLDDRGAGRETQTAASAAPTAAAAVLWCPRSGEESAALIAATVGRGLPTLALLRDTDVSALDFSKGHIEVSFAPFEAAEVLARVETALARARGPRDQNLIKHGELVIDQDRYEVTLAGRKVDLTYKEYELLKFLAARPGRVFSREALLRAVWDYDYFGGTRTVDVHVRRLRSKIDDMRNEFIETVWNVGYRFRSDEASGAEPVKG